MIWDSVPWKADLLATAKRLETMMRTRRPSERRLMAMEKDVFVGFYAVRKLIEANKVSTATKELNVPVVMYPSTGKATTTMNWHRVDQLFDFSKGRPNAVRLLDLANWVIHSYVYLPMTTSATGPVKSIIVASDRQRNQSIHEIELSSLASIFELVGRDFPVRYTSTYNDAKQDYDVVAYTPGYPSTLPAVSSKSRSRKLSVR